MLKVATETTEYRFLEERNFDKISNILIKERDAQTDETSLNKPAKMVCRWEVVDGQLQSYWIAENE